MGLKESEVACRLFLPTQLHDLFLVDVVAAYWLLVNQRLGAISCTPEVALCEGLFVA
jgi:hypothetical protein